METTGRMTRSKARAMATTPGAAAAPAPTSEFKTTGRRRGGKAAAQGASPPVEKRLAFDQPDAAPKAEEPDVTPAAQSEDPSDTAASFLPDQAGPSTAVEEQPAEEQLEAVAPPSPKANPTTVTPRRTPRRTPRGTPSKAMATPVDDGAHDEASVLMASPIPLSMSATTTTPAAAAAAATDMEEPAGDAAAPTPMQPLGGAAEEERPAAAYTPVAASPAAGMGFLSPVQQHMSPLPAASPLPMASPLPAEAQVPANALPPASPGMMAPVVEQDDAGLLGSPLPAGTPLSFRSDLPAAAHGAGTAAPSPMAASMPATPLSFAPSAVPDSSLPPSPLDPSAFTPGSFIPLGGMTPQQQQEAVQMEQEDQDDAMMDEAPAATPMSFMSDVQRGASPSPMAALAVGAAAPDTAPHPAAPTVPRCAAGPAQRLSTPGATDGALSAPSPAFQGFAVTPMPTGAAVEQQVESPSLEGLIAAAPAAANAGPSPAPSPSPFSLEVPAPPLGHLQDVRFGQTPAPSPAPMAAGSTPLGAPAGTPAPADVNMEMEEQMPAASPAPAAAKAGVTPKASPAVPKSAARTPLTSGGSKALAAAVAAAKTPSATPVAASSALRSGAHPANRTPVGRSTMSTVKTTPAAASSRTPAAVSATPVAAAAAPAATTPVAAAGTTTAGSKSAKRVSIQTPEGPQSSAPSLRKVELTPYHSSKSASRSASRVQHPEDEPEEDQEVDEMEEQHTEAVEEHKESEAAAERRAKAAERLRTIHAAEAPASSSLPGYLAPTASSMAAKKGKALASKVEAPQDYDPRSLNQLRREIQALGAKKAKEAGAVKGVCMSAPREPAKLTPKVAERKALPLVPREEDSDDDQENEHVEVAETTLVAAMDGLAVAPQGQRPMPLKGLPAPQGRHLRFTDNGKAAESPQRVVLRGMPVAHGKYKRFE